MIQEIATIDVINLALKDLNEGKVDVAKETLTKYRDKIQHQVDEFDKWAETQSDIDTQISLDLEGN